MRWMAAVAALVMACGGQEFMGHDAARSSEAKKPKASVTVSGPFVAATDGVYGGAVNVAFNPAGASFSFLAVYFECSQGGVVVLQSESGNLPAEVAAGYATQDADGTFHRAFSPLASQAYVGGAADCVVDGRGIDWPWETWTIVATGTFHIGG